MIFNPDPLGFWQFNFGHFITALTVGIGFYSSHVASIRRESALKASDEGRRRVMQDWIDRHERDCGERNKVLITMGQELVRTATLLDKLEERVDRVEQRTTQRSG